MLGIRLLLISICLATTAWATEYELDRSGSIFSLVMGKEGIASGLGHNHFIVAGEYEVTIASGEDDGAFAFEFTAPVDGLIADDPDLQARWGQSIQHANLLEKAFSTISEKNRRSIRETMLSPEQLHARMYPTIKAAILRHSTDDKTYKDHVYSYTAQLELAMHGETITIPVYFNISRAEDRITIEAVAPMRLTAIGIEPYTAMLGSIRVKDRCHFYARLVLRPKTESAAPEPEAAPDANGGQDACE